MFKISQLKILYMKFCLNSFSSFLSFKTSVLINFIINHFWHSSYRENLIIHSKQNLLSDWTFLWINKNSFPQKNEENNSQCDSLKHKYIIICLIWWVSEFDLNYIQRRTWSIFSSILFKWLKKLNNNVFSNETTASFIWFLRKYSYILTKLFVFFLLYLVISSSLINSFYVII
jgi:hypothetical protein